MSPEDTPFPEVLPFPEVAQQQETESPAPPQQEQGGSFDVPFPEVAGPREKSVGGFLGNVIPSAFKNVKEIGEAIGMAPIHGAKAVKDVFAEQFGNQPGKWEKNPETGRAEKKGLINLNRGGGYDQGEFFKELGKGWLDTWNRMGDTLIGKYTQKYIEQNPGEWEPDPNRPGRFKKREGAVLKAIGEAGYEDPVGVALDASVVKDVATAPLKLTGKGLSKAGDKIAATTAAKAMEGLSVGPKAIEAGLEATALPNVFQRTGEAIKTGAEAAAGIEGKLIGKVVGKGAELLGIDLPARKRALQYKGEELSRVPVKQADDYQRLLETYRDLGDAERAAVAEVQRLGEGAAPEALNIVRANPAARKAVEDYAGYMKGERETFLQEANLLDKKTLKRRVEAQYALEKYGSMDNAALAKARKDIGKMKEFRPSYVPSEAEIREGNGILDGMWGGKDEKMLGSPSVGRLGRVKFLEKFTGKAGISTDPIEYTKRVIDGYRKVEGNIRWIQRIESDPSLVKAVAKGEAKDIIPTEGVYKKYLQGGGRDRARAVYQMQLVKERGTHEAMRALAQDPAVIKRWKQISEISANDTVRKILSLEFSKWGQQPGAMLRGYEAVIGLFRKGATRWNPHYYSGNAVGDAILSLMDGVGPFTLGLAEKLKEHMPFQARRTASVNAEGVTTGRLGKVYDYINEVDAAGKRGIILKEVARELKDTGISKAQLEDALKDVLPSIQELSDVEVARIQLHERIAKGLGNINSANQQVRALARREKDLRKAIADALPENSEAFKAWFGDSKAVGKDGKPIRVFHGTEAQFNEFQRRPASESMFNYGNVPDSGGIFFSENPEVTGYYANDWDRSAKSRTIPVYLSIQKPAYLPPWAGDMVGGVEAQAKKLHELQAAGYDGAKIGNDQWVVFHPSQIKSSISGFKGQPTAELKASLGKLQNELRVVEGQKTALLRNYAEKAADAGTLEKMMPGLQEKAAIMRPAVERANAFFADYVGMGPIQQYVFRRLIPFFPFQKAMAMLAFKLPFIAPKATFLWNRYAEFMQGMTQDPDAPPGYIPFGVGKDGKTFWVSTKGISPFGGLRMTRTFGVEHPGFVDFIEQNPIIVTVGKGKGLKDLYSKTTPYSGELITGVHNGAVYEYQKDGTIKKVIDEAPLVKTLAHFFPIVGTVERAIFPYQLTRTGFPEYFKPELNRAGEVKYPNASLLNEPSQAVGNALGVRTIERSRDELRVAAAMREKGIRNEFKERIQNAQPDEREGLIQQYLDWLNSGRKVAPND